MFHEEKENYDSLINLQSNYMDTLFENLYEGLKGDRVFLLLVVFVFETFLEKNPTKTVALIIKYNFLFLFLENLRYPKVFDFLLNFISPMGKVFGFNQQL